MRRAAKVDANQKEVAQTLERLGWWVVDLSKVGGGVSDLLVGKRGVLRLVEIKDGSKPPSARKLTDDQIKWHAEAKAYGITVSILTSVEDAVMFNEIWSVR